MRVVVALNRPTGSLGRPRATGCASLADCAEVQSLSLSIRCVRSRTCYARCETSMPGNWSPAGTTRTPSKPWRRFPELGLRLRRNSVSASARSCKGDRRAALPVLRTNRIEALSLTRTQDEHCRVALFLHLNNSSGGIKLRLSGYALRGEPAVWGEQRQPLARCRTGPKMERTTSYFMSGC